MRHPISIPHLCPMPSEAVEVASSVDLHFEMAYTLVRARRVIEAVEMDEDEKAELLVELNNVYHYLRVPIDALLQDIGGRNN